MYIGRYYDLERNVSDSKVQCSTSEGEHPNAVYIEINYRQGLDVTSNIQLALTS